MGMFDTIVGLSTKCPHCGEEVTEAQTKYLECELSEYKVGDNIGTDMYNWISGTFSCRSNTCLDKEAEEFRTKGYGSSGFGTVFYRKIVIKDSIITGELKD